nr:hypothetical transcript [Hymenolepis microstoma]
MVLRDFSAHSTRWSYKSRYTGGEEIEDKLNTSPLGLIYNDENPATYLHYNGTRTTPHLLLVSSDISELARRKIIDNSGSGHKSAIASIATNSKCMTPKMTNKPSWNSKKADGPKLTNLLENKPRASPINYNLHPNKLCNNITDIIIRCAKKSIPLW